MHNTKIAVTIDRSLLSKLDKLVKERRFPSRSGALKEALRDKINRLDRKRLAHECAKLDKATEQQMAEEGIMVDTDQWPAY